MSTNPIAQLVDAAEAIVLDADALAAVDAARPAAPIHAGSAAHESPPPPDDEAGEGDVPSDIGLDGVDMDIVEGCAVLDASDTDNAERFIRHFGQDFAVIAQEGVAGGDRVVWCGTHWDITNGPALAQTLASRLGGRIGLEAGYLGHTPKEVAALKAAKDLGDDPDADGLSPAEKRAVKAALKARESLEKRKARRLNHAVTTKNSGRVKSMFEFADPRMRRRPDQFNHERLRVATQGHTLHFGVREVADPECPDPSATRLIKQAFCDAVLGHSREDWITACLPLAWQGLDAPAPRWRAFIAEMLVDADKRRTVQQFTGLGLTAEPLQHLMFHYGKGANGKSVFLETITRLLGSGIAVGLPRESIVSAGERGAGGASPDIIRLYGKRMVRILEVKADVPLQVDLVKRLTGGEAIPARALFKGYMEFQNTAKAHLSGNGFPSLDGGDYGTMRRILVVHWDQTIPEDRRRDFEEVVAGFIRDEGPGILAWLVEGVLDWLENGLVIAPSIRADTLDYADDQDPVGEFLRMCVRRNEGKRIGGGQLYEAFQNWRMANGKPTRSQKKVGTVASASFRKSEIGGRVFYEDVELFDVPDAPQDTRNPYQDR